MTTNLEEQRIEKTKGDIIGMAKLYNEKKKEIEEQNKQMKNLKEEILGLMEELEIRKVKNEELEVKIQYPKSFDLGSCRMEHPEEVGKFTTEETITAVNEIFNKKEFKKLYPELFEEFNTPLTPRLTIK